RRHTRSKRDWSSDVCSSDLHCHRFTPPNTSVDRTELHSLISIVRVHPGRIFERDNFVTTQGEPKLISRFTLFTDRRNRAVHSWFIRHVEPPVQIVFLFYLLPFSDFLPATRGLPGFTSLNP